MESQKQIYNLKEHILYPLLMNNLLMNNTSFLLSTIKIISGELRNLTVFKQGLIQLNRESPTYLVVNMVSKGHFHQQTLFWW